MVLICGAFLLFKSLLRLQQVDIGARIDHVITMSLDLPWDRYPTGIHLAAFYPPLVERVQRDSRRRVGVGLRRRAARRHRRREPADARPRGAAAHSLQARRRRLFRHPRHPGRGRPRLHARRTASARPYVAVVNEALARRLRDRFGVANPVGQAVDLPALGFGRDRRAAMTIVGVIGNERVRSDLRAPAEEVAYVPIAQAPRMQVKLAVRTHGDAAAAVPAIREAVREVDGRLALADIRTMEEIWAGSLVGRDANRCG